MSFPGKLLTFNIKTQIIWTMTILSIIAVLLTYVLINLVIYEIKEDLLKNYMEYYYTIQNEIFKSIISFQNFFLFNYEDTLHSLISQLAILVEISDNFTAKNNFTFSFKNLDNSIITNNSENIIFYKNESNPNSIIENDDNNLKITFRISNAFKTFIIPYYGDNQLFEDVIIYLNKTKTIYSTNNKFLNEFINKEIGNENINTFYKNLMNKLIHFSNIGLKQIISDNSVYPELTLPKEMLNYIKKYNDIKLYAKYSPFIDYKKEYLHLVTIEEESNEFYITVKLKSGLIDDIFLKMMEYFNITTLLLSKQDNTILNIMSCKALLVKLQFYFLSKNSEHNFEEIIGEIKKNFLNENVTFDKCIPDNENSTVQEYLEQYLKQNNSFSYQVNLGYNSSFVQLSNHKFESEFMSTRYSYPDFFLLKRRRPVYLISNNLNIYTFMNFYYPFTFVKDKEEFYCTKFLFVTFINWILYIIIFIILNLLGYKITKDITDPLIKLKKAIEQMSFNDETIFEYKNDDNIKELFMMCKELVNKTEATQNLQNLKEQYSEDIQIKYNTDSANNEQDMPLRKWGMKRNFSLNNQFFEKNGKILEQNNKHSIDEEIIVCDDNKFFPTSIPRTRSRRRPNIINTILDKKYDSSNSIRTRKDNNMSNKRNSFLRESLMSNNTIRNTINNFLESEIIKEREKENQIDYQLNLSLYELLFCLGKNMFRPNVKDKSSKRNYMFTQRLLSKDKIIRIFDSSNNIRRNKIEESSKNKYYNYDEPIYEVKDNISDFYNEDIISNNDQDKDNTYKINFKKNVLYYKYLRMKKNSNNNFLKNTDELVLDSDANEEMDKNENIFLLSRKAMKKNDSNSTLKNIKDDLFIKSNPKKSIFKNIFPNKKTNKNFQRGISAPIKGNIRNSLYNKNKKSKKSRTSVTFSSKSNTIWEVLE